MDFVYVFFDENNWEDMIIFLSKEDAINKSKECPKARVEIFSITNKLGSGLGALAIGAWFLIHEYIPFGIETPFFNSFEIYHAISVFCLMCTCLMNYSMFKRTINELKQIS